MISPLKLRLAQVLNEALDARQLTQREAARLLGMTQPKISALRNYKLTGRGHGHTAEHLMLLLTAVDRDVEITIRKTPAGRRGQISVVVDNGPQ